MPYIHMTRIGFRRNLAYRWAHMINNIASAIFGFIYIALWQAVAPENPTMTSLMIMTQSIAFVAIFLPAGLGIQNSVRSGSIALELTRPVPFSPLVVAREAGMVAYQGLYRSLPVALLFALTLGYPRPASAANLALFIPSVALAAYVGLLLFYLIGLSSLWTGEIRWAHWSYHSCVTLLSGGWIPAHLLPGWLGKVAPYLPFACQAHYPTRIYLGLAGWEGLLVQVAWALALTLGCQWLSARALRRVAVQGG